ncbi:MAG: 4-vinyl reductase [Candidatus Methanomethylicia archaeon]
MSNNALELGRIIFIPNMDIYGFNIRITDKVGVEVNILATLKKYRVNIIYALISISPQNIGQKLGVFICNFTGLDVKPVNILDEIKNIDGVIDAEIIQPIKKGFIIDDRHFPLFLGGVRTVVFRQFIVEGLLKRLREQYGSAFDIILYHQGFETGKVTYKYFEENYCLGGIEEFIKADTAIAKAVGWYELIIEKIDLKNREAKVILKDSFECVMFKDSKTPKSSFTRGFLAGLFTEIFRVKAQAYETKCIAIGDPYCEFQVKVEQ